MKRFILLLLAVCGLTAGVITPVQAAPQNWDWGNEWGKPAVAQTATQPQSWDWGSVEANNHITGWKMGRLPNHSSLCIAEGVDGVGNGYNYEYVIGRINNHAYAPTISVRNSCSGYSIENRATIESYVDGTTTCAKFTNTGRYWDNAQADYIWYQNPIIWYNLNDFCAGDSVSRAHRTTMYLEYILGLQYHTTNVNAAICSTTYCIQNIAYANATDHKWLGWIYGAKA